MEVGAGFRSKIRTTRAPDCFQPARNIDARVELLCFQQSIVSVVKLVALDIEPGQRQTLARCFVRSVFVRCRFPAYVRAREWSEDFLQRRAQTFDRSFGRLIFDEKLGVEQRGIDLADVFGL